MERVSVDLCVSEDAARFLSRLQARFAMACDFTAEEARRNGCFARVALHHAVYSRLRERFADLGAQMACNAIYTVARTYRQLRPNRSQARWGVNEAPRLRFALTAPVFFDRHTLSLRGSRVSMFTLDGRLRFDLKLRPEQAELLNEGAVKEVVLTGGDRPYRLVFFIAEKATEMPARVAAIEAGEAVLVDSE